MICSVSAVKPSIGQAVSCAGSGLARSGTNSVTTVKATSNRRDCIFSLLLELPRIGR